MGTYFLSPSTPSGSQLFHAVGEKFIQRQAASLGVAQWNGPHYYLADAYNEMPPPTTNTTFLGSVSKSMYDSMASADSAALMVTQGWFLSAVPRLPWGEDQARAFLHGPPQGRLLVHSAQDIKIHDIDTRKHITDTYIWRIHAVPSRYWI